jgi:hypothetical protein
VSAWILYLLDEVDGYLPGAVNVFHTHSSNRPWGTPRIYLISEQLPTEWAESYPGEADLTTFRPFIIGLQKNRDYSDLEGPYWWSWGDVGPYGFDQQGIFWELMAFSPDRRSFVDLQHQYEGTSLPGGTQLLLLDPDHIDWVHLTFLEQRADPVVFGTSNTPEILDTGHVSYMFIHFRVWWDIGQ